MRGFEVCVLGHSAYFKFLKDGRDGYMVWESYDGKRIFKRFKGIKDIKIIFKSDRWGFKIADRRGTTATILRIYPGDRHWKFEYEFDPEIGPVETYRFKGIYTDYQAERFTL